ncbi:MAG: response regulator [Oscillospiraceae bacterium]|nr:response regulator [Oscillospiraceae bacterium]
MNIIAVDDEYLQLIDLALAIKTAIPTANIQTFESPTDAAAFGSKNLIDIAYLDINMPGLSGIELAKKLRDTNPQVNIIFTTGYDEYAKESYNVQASGYLTKPITDKAVADSLKHLRKPVDLRAEKKLRVQCFGNFDVFANGNILYFKRQKSKELLAYLVHKRGTSCTIKELCAVIYDESVNAKSMDKQIQSVISVMMKTLKEADAEDVITKNYNSISIDVSKVDCDYYRYLVKDPSLTHVYTGEYMTNYEWAEFRPEYFEGF